MAVDLGDIERGTFSGTASLGAVVAATSAPALEDPLVQLAAGQLGVGQLGSSCSTSECSSSPGSQPDEFSEWWRSAGDRVQAWLLNGVTYTGDTQFPGVSDPNRQIKAFGDFNGDGQTDILWQSKDMQTYRISLLLGENLLQEITLPAASAGQLVGVGDFNGDGRTDLLWRNFQTGSNTVGLSTETSDGLGFSPIALPAHPGSNLSVEAVGDFNQDGRADILWRNYLSGEVVAELLDGTQTIATQLVATAPDSNWQILTAADLNQDGQLDLLWRNAATGQSVAWALNGLTYTGTIDLPSGWDQNLSFAAPQLPPTGQVTIANLTFSGKEGDAGTFQVQLSQAPESDVTLTFAPGSAGEFLTIDADGDGRNGTQISLTFTTQDWNLPHTVSFIAEVDDSGQNRLLGNTIHYSLSGGVVGTGEDELATITNTNTPDPTRFNIDLDFRNDFLGFWTAARRTIAQQAADDWANRIANEWPDFQLDATIDRLDSDRGGSPAFTAQRFVDDLLVFVNDYQITGAGEGGLASPDYDFGGWAGLDGAAVGTPTRVGQIAINPVFANYPDLQLYQVVSHEIGHTLGLLGLNWTSYVLEDRSNPLTATFRGEYSRSANGGDYVPLQSQDGGDYSHPAASVESIMSYGWIYQLTAPSAIDWALLADSGYAVYGINA